MEREHFNDGGEPPDDHRPPEEPNPYTGKGKKRARTPSPVEESKEQKVLQEGEGSSTVQLEEGAPRSDNVGMTQEQLIALLATFGVIIRVEDIAKAPPPTEETKRKSNALCEKLHCKERILAALNASHTAKSEARSAAESARSAVDSARRASGQVRSIEYANSEASRRAAAERAVHIAIHNAGQPVSFYTQCRALSNAHLVVHMSVDIAVEQADAAGLGDDAVHAALNMPVTPATQEAANAAAHVIVQAAINGGNIPLVAQAGVGEANNDLQHIGAEELDELRFDSELGEGNGDFNEMH